MSTTGSQSCAGPCPGVFGENLTTTGVDVNGALIGERWLVFRALTLEPALLPSILAADELEEETRQMARTGKTFTLG